MIYRLVAITSLLTLALSGCGSGSDKPPSHTDYLRHIATARWEQQEVLYRVHGGPPNPLGSEVRRTVKRGLDGWQDAMQGYIRLREAQDGETENISVRFVKVGSLGGSFTGQQTLGRATLQYKPGDRVISSALIELDSQLWFRLPTLQATSAHEGGHGLGIRGHSPYPSDLMYAAPGRSTPSSADARTIALAYAGVE